MRATWYVLEDGTPVDPAEVTRDESGALIHANGKVAVGAHGNYRTHSVDLDEIAANKAMQTEPNKKPGYKNRETKTR